MTRIIIEIYDFVAGRSVVAPIGLLVAVLIALFGHALAPPLLAGAFLATLIVTFWGSALERAR